jgi:hypothetical protein
VPRNIAAIRDRRIAAGKTAIGKATAQRAPLQVPDVLKQATLVLDAFASDTLQCH